MYSGLRFVQGIIDLFIGLAEAILGLRVIFRLFAANANNTFVHWIYDTSNTLMEPFRGIFPSVTLSQGHVLDISALFSMLVYAIVGYLLLALVGAVPAPTSRSYWRRNTVAKR